MKGNTALRRLAILISVMLLSITACKSHNERSDNATLMNIESSLENGSRLVKGPRRPPPEISAALMPAVKIDMASAGHSGEERFDVNINETPAKAFLMGLVEGTPYNMVVHPSVDGTISLNLKNVTVPEVMTVLRDVYGFEYMRTGRGYRVLPARMQSRIFEIDYLNIRRNGKSQTRVSSGQLTESTTSNDNSSSTTVEKATGTEINTESDSDFWGELSTALKSIVGNTGGRSVVVSPQSGIVVVRAMPMELREVERFLNATQNNMQRQVIIEAKVVEVQLNDGAQTGINWAGLIRSGSDTLTLGHIGGGSVFGNANGTSGISGNTGNLDPAAYSAITATSAAAFGGVFSAAIRLADFTAFIELLKSQGDVQILSSPRISTVNNQKAVIKVGSDEYFVTEISSTTTTGTTTTVTPEIKLAPFFSGIALDVTPRISANGEVILHIHPAVSEVTDQTKVIQVFGQTQTLPLALSTVRESDSVIKAASGQVVVIGGLMQDRATIRSSATPGISDAPIIGNLFKHTKDEIVKSELVILLRPIVVDSPNVWRNQTRESLDRIKTHYGLVGSK